MPKQRVGNVELYYEIAGKGKPLLFIHGLGSSTRDWEPQMEMFSKRYRVVTVDVRGHGRSDKPPGPYSIPQFAGDIISLARYLELGTAHVVGLSLGGMIAFQMAVDEPDMVSSLTIINSAPEMIPRTFAEHLAIWQRLVLFRVFSMRKVGEVIGKQLFPDPDQAFLREMFAARWAENDKRAYMAATRALMGWSVVDRLSAIRCPVLVVAADQDYTPVSAKEKYVGLLPNAELIVVENARHAFPFAQPEKFNPVLDAFLARH